MSAANEPNDPLVFTFRHDRPILTVSIIIGRFCDFQNRSAACTHGDGGRCTVRGGVSLCKCTRKPGPRSTHPLPATANFAPHTPGPIKRLPLQYNIYFITHVAGASLRLRSYTASCNFVRFCTRVLFYVIGIV